MTPRKLTRAEQIAGYLKLTSAFFTVAAGGEDTLLQLRNQMAQEMDTETITLAAAIKWHLGGWYDGDKNYSDARKIEAKYAGEGR